MIKYIEQAGRMYKGQLFTGVRDVEDGNFQIRTYKNGLLHGPFIAMYDKSIFSSIYIVRMFRNGVEDGVRRTYNKSGVIANISHIKNEKYIGLAIQYDIHAASKEAYVTCCKFMAKDNTKWHVDFDSPTHVTRAEGGKEKCLKLLTDFCMNWFRSPEFTQVPTEIQKLIDQRRALR